MSKITIFRKSIVAVIMLLTSIAYAQQPDITSFTPSVITHRTSVTINGSGFTGVTAANVKFAGIAATSVSINGAGTQIVAVVGSGSSVTGPVTVTKNQTATSASNVTYMAPTATNSSTARVTRIVTDFDGYWNSNATSDNPALQPDTSHSLLGFQYGGTMYSTGSTTASTVLGDNGVSFTSGNFRALPVNNLTGNTGSSTGSNPNLIVLASKIDGDPDAQVATAPGVAGLSVRDVLIDGIRGLDLGTGVTNLPSTAVLLFNSSTILTAGISDNVPDILVSQIADPSNSSYSVYSFVDASGNIVGNPIQVALNSIPAVGRYKSDFFSLPSATSLNTATVNGTAAPGGSTRDIRMVAYKLSDFGITTANKDNAVYFKVMPSGTSDIAFMAYNRDAFQIPAPIITAQPTSQVACTGGSNSATFTVTATGEELTYQWEKNGTALTDGGDISGATTASLTISNVDESDVAMYRVLITNASGAALSNWAFLNTMITVQPTDEAVCQDDADASLSFSAGGSDLNFQWYSNTSSSNTGGTLIAGAVNDTIYPATDVPGTFYYYATAQNGTESCTQTATDPVTFTVSAAVEAGEITNDTIICSGNSTVVALANSSGSIQWQQSLDGSTGWANVTGGSGANTTIYTTPTLTETTYYRAEVTSGSCGTVYSDTSKVEVTDSNIWIGTENYYWVNEENWLCNTIPTLSDDVIIPVVDEGNFYPDITGINGVADCRNLTIESGAMVTVSNEGFGNLRIAGTLTNNGTLDVSDGTVSFMGSQSQTIPSGAFTGNTIRNLSIFNTNQVSLAGPLDLTGIFSPSAGTFYTNNNLTLKSNAETTAVINKVLGTVSGEMTIERYIPARRAFRLISSPTTGGTIQSNWQEGQPETDPTGLGTDITGTGGATNGFDVSGSNNPSMFTHNNATSLWQAVTSTTTTLTAGVPYRLFVRGDRTIDQASNSSTATNTTLRTTGTIASGTINVTDLSSTAGAFNFVGNPYQAPVNMELVLDNATNLNNQYYYIWDPTRNTRGSYVTVNVLANTNNISGSVATRYLQPGQAFFVQTQGTGAASLSFTENYKYITTNDTPNLYRTAQDTGSMIRLSMFTEDAYTNGGNTADGFVVLFDDTYSNDVDGNDAVKPVNQDENVGLLNNGTKLSFETRAMPTAEDVIAIANTTYRTTNYVYSIEVNELNGVSAYLLDKYNDTMTALANNDTTEYSFVVDGNDELSSALNRFDIIFESNLGTDVNTATKVVIYPNPVTDNNFTLRMPDAENAEVTLFDVSGREVKCTVSGIGANEVLVSPTSKLSAGVYMVQVKGGSKASTLKIIVK